MQPALQEGNTGGEHPLRARCSPWIGLRLGYRSGRRTRLARDEPVGQLQDVEQVADRRPRAALCAARLVESLLERTPTAVPWRERPPEMTAWRATSAASDVVAHATDEMVMAPRAGVVSPLEPTVILTRNLRENLRHSSTLFSHWFRLSDRNG